MDFYARGIEKLRSDAINDRLGRFHWPTTGEDISVEAQNNDDLMNESLVSQSPACTLTVHA